MARLMQIRFTSSTSNRRPYGGDRATIRCSPHPKVRNFSARLASTISATTITYSLQHRDHVHRLDAGNSCLGDNGCVHLFRFLTSPAGQKYRNSITELYLTSNEIGAKGLQALSAYLSGNEVLRELCLSGNPLATDPDTVIAFAAALNTSRLCTLHLIHNGELSDDFVSLFLPQLTTPYLRQLNMSAIGMTRMSVPVIIKYVSSAVCRLEGLQCNANSLTLPGARDIVSAIEEHNYSLWKVTLDDLHIDTDHDGEERMQAWQGTLDSVCRRNSQMKKK
ncbi:hypothetical protein SERLA73DRAFT_175528 [Serpula lacrymans var. lacrymans S7.3]|uniref:Uncharacterized protein n=2 Tax=Serpula lacrymans var. lacrymans TaxID=341189 RepID=F8PKD5_SERL3|nr:hypothetical protein SERLA73DRAFT_175528 [Serpula lacrymans var. lacrymans S7.3]